MDLKMRTMLGLERVLFQEYPWSCLAACFAYEIGISEKDLHFLVGHDGSEIWWPEKETPWNRRAFHPQELIDVAGFHHGKHFMAIEVNPGFAVGSREKYIWTPAQQQERLDRYLRYCDGILTGETKDGRPHAVVWDRRLEMIRDPNGRMYPRSDFKIEFFFTTGE